LPSSQWIAEASALVIREKRPELSLVYLPHLDYDFQRFDVHDLARLAEVDGCAGKVIDAAHDIGATVIAVSEYGLVPVSKPVHLNRELRRRDWLSVRDGPFGEILMPSECQAFAVADHQLAHVYVHDKDLIPEVRRELESINGVATVLEPGDIELDHQRSGELIALAKPDAWFTYYYWLDEERAPDFARTVDIHRKPGYDPCELLMTSHTRAILRLAQKSLGFRYRMDVIPLDATLVRGSHGVHPTRDEDGPLIVGPGDLPDDMRDFAGYARALLGC
jgi:predicted AlkP superfamily pyrophosphatase or phosphodiesterase